MIAKYNGKLFDPDQFDLDYNMNGGQNSQDQVNESLLTRSNQSLVLQTSILNQVLAGGNKKKSPSLSYWLGRKKILINLIVVACIWLVVSFDYYIINYLASHFQNAYSVVIASQIGEISAKLPAVILYKLIGPKKSLSLALFISCLASIAIILYGQSHQHTYIFFFLIFVAKCCIAISFCILYIAHASIFPIMFAATSFGICNFLARIFAIASPIIAELEQPVPMICFAIAAAVACILTSFIQVRDD